MTLWSPCAPDTCCGSACCGAHVSLKYELDIVTGLLQFMCVGSLAGVTYLRYTALTSADNSCPLLRSCFIGSCHVGVSKRFSRSISPAVYTVFTHFYFG